jgi:hypothetical protein
LPKSIATWAVGAVALAATGSSSSSALSVLAFEGYLSLIADLKCTTDAPTKVDFVARMR